jgi:prepilin-type N-terminal cleavage/methylation domain-containing protein
MYGMKNVGAQMKEKEKRERVRGFTLTELMIGISVIGLIAILALPNYNRFIQSWRLKGETQQFAAALRSARSAAIMKNIDVVFTFDTDASTYSYFEDSNGDGGHDASEYMSSNYELPPCISITAFTLSNPTLTFGSKGNTRESGTITLRNLENNTMNIRIYGGTGNITID